MINHFSHGGRPCTLPVLALRKRAIPVWKPLAANWFLISCSSCHRKSKCPFLKTELSEQVWPTKPSCSTNCLTDHLKPLPRSPNSKSVKYLSLTQAKSEVLSQDSTISNPKVSSTTKDIRLQEIPIPLFKTSNANFRPCLSFPQQHTLAGQTSFYQIPQSCFPNIVLQHQHAFHLIILPSFVLFFLISKEN